MCSLVDFGAFFRNWGFFVYAKVGTAQLRYPLESSLCWLAQRPRYYNVRTFDFDRNMRNAKSEYTIPTKNGPIIRIIVTSENG